MGILSENRYFPLPPTSKRATLAVGKSSPLPRALGRQYTSRSITTIPNIPKIDTLLSLENKKTRPVYRRLIVPVCVSRQHRQYIGYQHCWINGSINSGVKLICTYNDT